MYDMQSVRCCLVEEYEVVCLQNVAPASTTWYMVPQARGHSAGVGGGDTAGGATEACTLCCITTPYSSTLPLCLQAHMFVPVAWFAMLLRHAEE
jgi:hypothetical protein